MSIGSPLDISGLRVWYSAKAETGLSDGAQMSTWTDQSGNSRHATGVAGSGGSKPLWHAADVEFQSGSANQVGGYFTVPASVFTGLTSATVVAVLKSAQGRTTHWQLGGSGSGEGHYPYDDVCYENAFVTSRVSVSANYSSGPAPGPLNTLKRYMVKITPTTIRSWWNNSPAYTAASRTFATPTTPKLGGGNAYNFAGRIAFFAIYDHELTTGEGDDLDAWLSGNMDGGSPSVDATLAAPTATATFGAEPPVLVGDLSLAAPTATATLGAHVPTIATADDESFLRVELVVGGYSWTVTNADPPGYGPLDGLRFGWSRMDQLGPAHPDHSTATFGIVVAEGSDLIDLDDDDPVAIRVWVDAPGAPEDCQWSFYGRVTAVQAVPHSLGMSYTVSAAGYTVDLAELRTGLVDWLTELGTPGYDEIYLDMVLAEAYQAVRGFQDFNLVRYPVSSSMGAGGTEPVGPPPVGLDNAWSRVMGLLRSVIMEGSARPHPALPALLPYADDTGPGDATGHLYCIERLDKYVYTDEVPLPGQLVVDGPDVSVVIDPTHPGVIDASWIETDATQWTRDKDRRPNVVNVTGVDNMGGPVYGKAVRPPQGMTITEDVEIINAGAPAMAEMLLPDPSAPHGWAAESYRYRLSDNPAGLPLMMHNPADHALPAQEYRSLMYSRPLVILDIATRHNPTNRPYIAGQIRAAEVTINSGEVAVDFQLSRTVPLPAPVSATYTPSPRGYLALEDFATDPVLSTLTLADLADVTLYDFRLIREPD